MHKLTIAAVGILIVVACTEIYVEQWTKLEPTNEVTPVGLVVPDVKSDPKNTVYLIDGQSYSLDNGTASVPSAPGSESMNILAIFGEPVVGDLDADGDADAAVVLTLTTGGSGTCYYAALTLNTNDTYTSSNTLLLGDRIAPQTVEIRDGRAVFNYAERRADEPMTTQPSVGKSLWIHLDKTTGQIGEWVKDFEGEVDTTTLKLDAHQWKWIRTDVSGKASVTPKKVDSFLLTFKTDNSFTSTTDCNTVGGSYITNGSAITLSNVISTLMFCEDAEESTYVGMLTGTASYSFGTKGELILKSKEGDGTMIFQ
jgi:heat shock protein HslJ